MTVSARIISDSIAECSPRLVTILARYPKFIHGELMTHRVFSRNASSSRAIPVERLIKDIMDDPVIPMHWGANQKGMQAGHECNENVYFNYGLGKYDYFSNEKAWLIARDNAIHVAEAFNKAGYHKQIVNRIIEPWCHINVVVTATEWSNFFALRRHKDAQPEMKALADAMYDAMENSTPQVLKPGQWHLPFIDFGNDVNPKNFTEYSGKDAILYDRNGDAIKVSVARCARTSYMTHEGKEPNIEEDLKLYTRLVGQIPLHASPAEHQASPDWPGPHKGEWLKPHLHGNLKGWVQFRKTLAGENQ